MQVGFSTGGEDRSDHLLRPNRTQLNATGFNMNSELVSIS
jgi:hypothetical protein